MARSFPTQREIGAHLGMAERNARDLLQKLGINHKQSTLDEIRLAYIKHLRDVAAGHQDEEGYNIVKERCLTERVDRESKLWDLAKKKELLVSVDELTPELEAAIAATRTGLLALSVRIKSIVDVQYDIDLDMKLIDDQVYESLRLLAEYDPGGSQADPDDLETA